MMSAIGLGRRRSLDDRDHAHLIPRRSLARMPSSRYWDVPAAMDQGSTSQCVAYSGYQYLRAAPIINRHPRQWPSTLYRMCLKVDEFEGEDWDGGTSVRALFKVLKTLGYVTAYEWAFDAETIVGHLLAKGPIVVGTNWHMDMFMPDDQTGFIHATGPNQGGHAWLLIGADRNCRNPDGSHGAVLMLNSWGRSWGAREGKAWVSFGDLDKLIKEDGEACVATEIKISGMWQPNTLA